MVRRVIILAGCSMLLPLMFGCTVHVGAGYPAGYYYGYGYAPYWGNNYYYYSSHRSTHYYKRHHHRKHHRRVHKRRGYSRPPKGRGSVSRTRARGRSRGGPRMMPRGGGGRRR